LILTIPASEESDKMYLYEQLENFYDVIVVGAGPSGSMAAWHAARNGARVLLLEKDRDVGTPVRCAEGVAKNILEELVEQPIPPTWIASQITKFRLFSPDGTPVYVHVDEVGLVLHRRLFDYDLALKAVQAGAKLLTGAAATDVLKKEGILKGVQVAINGRDHNIKCSIIIAADGVESRVARWAGINSTVPLKEMETCVQYTLAGIPIESDTCDFYFSRDFAPGGYAWVFPKGEKIANVGLGISGNYARNKDPQNYLHQFLLRYFPTSSIISQTVGGVPVDRTLKNIVSDGLIIVGDAAHQANPISGGGIISGMIAGKIAGQVAAEAIRKNKFQHADLIPYARQWHKTVGKTHQRYYRLKEALTKFSDQHLNNIAKEYLNLEPDKQNLMTIFKLAFKHNPAFLIDVIKLFTSM